MTDTPSLGGSGPGANPFLVKTANMLQRKAVKMPQPGRHEIRGDTN